MALVCEVVYYMKIIKELGSIHNKTNDEVVEQVKHTSVHENHLPQGDKRKKCMREAAFSQDHVLVVI